MFQYTRQICDTRHSYATPRRCAKNNLCIAHHMPPSRQPHTARRRPAARHTPHTTRTLHAACQPHTIRHRPDARHAPAALHHHAMACRMPAAHHTPHTTRTLHATCTPCTRRSAPSFSGVLHASRPAVHHMPPSRQPHTTCQPHTIRHTLPARCTPPSRHAPATPYHRNRKYRICPNAHDTPRPTMHMTHHAQQCT